MSFLFQDETSGGEKEKLFENFIDVIRECEKVYVSQTTSNRSGLVAGSSQVETTTTTTTAIDETLCRTIEAILFNGLRSKPLSERAADSISDSSNLLMIQQFAMFGLKINSGSEAGQNVWLFLRNFLPKQEQEKFALLKNIYTYSGLIRAWIRSTLNEKSSEKYFEQILHNHNLLLKYYADEALVRDAAKTTQLQNAFQLLNSITFSFQIDNECLNDGKKVFREPIIVCELPEKRRETMSSVAAVTARKQVHDSIVSLTTDDSLKLSDDESLSFDRSKRKNVGDDQEEEDEEEEEDDDDDEEGSEDEDEDEANQEVVSLSSVNCLTTNADGKNYKLRTVASSSSSAAAAKKPETDPIENASDISAVIRVIEERKDTEIKCLHEKVANLKAENAKLKIQLKNYADGITSLRESTAVTRNPTDSDLVKLFENKFIKFADMHAELLEFNNILQNEIQQKDVIIEKYQRELIGIRGPLTDDDNDSESFLSATSNYVSIWVPSAFLTGTGSSAHHVYQIYIKAGTDDWNIYRRYSQFYALHCDLKKIDSVVTTFGFPPKKKIRNKKESLVEKRKYKFQSYLRKIIAHWPELSKCSNRASLEHKLNFFKDSFTTDKSWSVNALTNIYSGL